MERGGKSSMTSAQSFVLKRATQGRIEKERRRVRRDETEAGWKKDTGGPWCPSGSGRRREAVINDKPPRFEFRGNGIAPDILRITQETRSWISHLTQAPPRRPTQLQESSPTPSWKRDSGKGTTKAIACACAKGCTWSWVPVEFY